MHKRVQCSTRFSQGTPSQPWNRFCAMMGMPASLKGIGYRSTSVFTHLEHRALSMFINGRPLKKPKNALCGWGITFCGCN